MADTYISTLIQSGADAMKNLYEVSFTLPTALSNQYSNEVPYMKIRTAGFDPPAASLATYENHYKTISVTVPSSKITLDRSFTLTIRVDAYYKVYKMLKAWEALKMKAYDGLAVNTFDPANCGTVTVKALSKPMDATMTGSDFKTGDTINWTYQDVWIQSITGLSYSHNSSEPNTVSVKFIFGNYTEPALT